MDYFYSPSTGGFYLTIVHGKKMPADVVKVSEADHEELIRGQNNDVEIVPDPGRGGYPMLKPRATEQ